MRAGTLRHRVTIQESRPARSADGGVVQDWADVATVWAAVEELSGREAFDQFGQQELAKKLVRIRIRYRSGITHKMRVVWGTRYFDIQQVNEVDIMQREIYLICEEVPDG